MDRRISINENLLAKKTQEEILIQTISKVKQLSEENLECEIIKNAFIDFFKWLVENSRYEELKEFPVFCRKKDDEGKEKLVLLSEHQKLLGPIEIWQEPYNEYSELFPQELILSSVYHNKVQYDKWCELKKVDLIFLNPLFLEKRNLKSKELELLSTTRWQFDIENEEEE